MVRLQRLLTFTLSTTDNAGAGCPVTHTMRQSHFPGSQSHLWFWLSHAGDTPLPPSWFGSSINLRSLGNGETQPSVTGHQVVKESPGRAFMHRATGESGAPYCSWPSRVPLQRTRVCWTGLKCQLLANPRVVGKETAGPRK